MHHSNKKKKEKEKRREECVSLTGVSLTAYLYGPVGGGALTFYAQRYAHRYAHTPMFAALQLNLQRQGKTVMNFAVYVKCDKKKKKKRPYTKR